MRAVPVARSGAKPESVRPRATSTFPPPPVDRPRVFERPARVEEPSARTSLRPPPRHDVRDARDERTSLRPMTYESASPAVAARPMAVAIVERPSLRAVTFEVEAPSVAAIRPPPRERVAIAATAALFAPIVLAFAFLGPGDAVAATATLITPPVLATAVLETADAHPTAITPPPAPVVAAASAPPVAPPAPAVIDIHPAAVAPPPRPVVASTPRAYAPRPAILTPPAARPVATKAASKSGLPDAEAANALARAQLEAALR
jgi:hypothetical protein